MPSRSLRNNICLMGMENVGILGISGSYCGLAFSHFLRWIIFSGRHHLNAWEGVKVFLLGFGLICKIKAFWPKRTKSCLYYHFPQVSVWISKFSLISLVEEEVGNFSRKPSQYSQSSEFSQCYRNFFPTHFIV